MKSIGLTGVIVNKVCGFGKEREKPQKIYIDVSLETDFKAVAEEDDPSAGIDFRTIYTLIRKGLEGEIYTLEKAALSILRQLKGLDNVGKVEITVKKINPTFQGEVKNSWVTIEE
ncbi:dihydroneopterin aldolase [candidate division WOR-3 bacterium]|nr:dihydroneopterin aldolase [candidate division WOR-3 bacterium]